MRLVCTAFCSNARAENEEKEQWKFKTHRTRFLKVCLLEWSRLTSRVHSNEEHGSAGYRQFRRQMRVQSWVWVLGPATSPCAVRIGLPRTAPLLEMQASGRERHPISRLLQHRSALQAPLSGGLARRDLSHIVYGPLATNSWVVTVRARCVAGRLCCPI